ncbi:MAG: hypothetical protein EA385_05560 [Salinarimonadaceae bacterium]|nr:MAG: hypothetical protein EA385_05560 [Salinarimonadaceae bacterium]
MPVAAASEADVEGLRRVALLPPIVGAAQQARPHGWSGIALEGYDPVSYFLDAGPRPGAAAHEVVWNGVAWRFSSAANRAAFVSRPEAYAPRLGGFDALAMAQGRLVEAASRFAAIVDKRLYLFSSREARDAFLDNPQAVLQAEAVWRNERTRLERL